MKQKLGLVELAWNLKLVLPLAKAHQLQLLLTEAVKFEDRGYGQRKFAYTYGYTVPDVRVLTNDCPVYDATSLTDDEVRDWSNTAAKGLEESKTPDASSIIPPELWVSMLGDQA